MLTTHPARRRRRADAERSIAAIVAAAADAFSRRPDVSMTEIATAAGVGRVTLYAHFPSREAVLEAAIDHALAEASASLDDARLDEGPALAALDRMVDTSWAVLDRYRGLLVAAGGLEPLRLRDRHGAVLARMERLIARGQAERAFRVDLPAGWLVAVCYSLFHAAALEVDAGRLSAATAAGVIADTLRGALGSPD